MEYRRGIKEGVLRGRNAQLSELIKKKLDKGKSIPKIAEEWKKQRIGYRS